MSAKNLHFYVLFFVHQPLPSLPVPSRTLSYLVVPSLTFPYLPVLRVPSCTLPYLPVSSLPVSFRPFPLLIVCVKFSKVISLRTNNFLLRSVMKNVFFHKYTVSCILFPYPTTLGVQNKHVMVCLIRARVRLHDACTENQSVPRRLNHLCPVARSKQYL